MVRPNRHGWNACKIFDVEKSVDPPAEIEAKAVPRKKKEKRNRIRKGKKINVRLIRLHCICMGKNELHAFFSPVN